MSELDILTSEWPLILFYVENNVKLTPQYPIVLNLEYYCKYFNLNMARCFEHYRLIKLMNKKQLKVLLDSLKNSNYKLNYENVLELESVKAVLKMKDEKSIL